MTNLGPAIIFDIDGTLVDSVDLHARAWQESLSHFGIDVPYDVVRSQIGKGGDQLLPALVPREKLAKLQGPIEKYRGDLFKREFLPKVRAFPKVRDLFERVRERRRIGLASSAKADEVEIYKTIARIDDLVDAETSADDVDRSKPHPDVFHVVLDKLEVEAHEAAVVGDTPYDAIAASRAELRTIGVLCGGFPAEDLTGAGCIALFRDPEDILSRYDEFEDKLRTGNLKLETKN
jgi:HAD superfamily hydrolase (TIGR01509 family)